MIAPDVGGGFGSKLDVYAEEALCLAIARRLHVPVKWIEERSEAFTATIHGRDVLQEIELAATAEGIDHRRPRPARLGDGRVPAARHARDPAARRLDLRRLLRHPGLQLRVHGRLHAHDADRRLPRRRPARGDLRDRAGDGRARDRARDGSGRAAPPELHHRVPGHDRVRPHGRLGRLQRLARQGARAARPRGGSRRAGRAARARRREAARDRLLDLRRDVRPRSVGDPRRDPLRRRRLGRGHDPLPAERHGAGAHRHVAARAGARDGLVADHGRRARLRASTRSRCCTATRA